MMTSRSNFTLESLQEQLGYSNKKLECSLEKLSAASLVRHLKNDTFRVCSIYDAFYVKSIIAIEAKIRNWKNAFVQAETNFWFASESYVLLPGESLRNSIIDKAAESPAGLLSYCNNNYDIISKSERRSMPVSYCSWIFNEHVGKLHSRAMESGMDRSKYSDIFPSLSGIEELSSGGYKTVYKAVHPSHGDVVLKII